MRTVDITVTGDPASARAAAVQALEARKFRITWEHEWSGTAERGSKVLNVVAGALAQYFKVGLKIFSGTPGEVVVRFERQSSGWMGGGIGEMRTNRNMDRLRDEVAAAFREQGILVGVAEQK